MNPQALSVVLTGATDPVGPALARALVNRGARVLLVARQAPPLVALARALAAPDDHRHQVDALAADIATSHGCRAVVDAAVARSANVLANAPGADLYTSRDPLDVRTLEAGVAGSMAPTVQITRALLPHLLTRVEARVLNIGPCFVPGAPADLAAIRASQDALRALSDALRREVAGSMVRVQFLGRRSSSMAADPRAAQPADTTGASRGDRPEYIASVAVQMLLAGTHERFLGLRGDLLGRVNAVLAALLAPAASHRRTGRHGADA